MVNFICQLGLATCPVVGLNIHLDVTVKVFCRCDEHSTGCLAISKTLCKQEGPHFLQ